MTVQFYLADDGLGRIEITQQPYAHNNTLERPMFDDAVFWLSLSTLIVVLLSLARNSSPASNTSRLERKLDLILSHLGLDPNKGVDEKIRQLMIEGQKIQAIKLYREQTGVGLKEAKDYVEGL